MLENIWFILWGVLWAVYFMLGGFDLGIGVLLPFLAKTEGEKRTVLRTIAPFWDGNEVWLITAGGVTFAAFPGAYAALFSSMYTPLMFVLFALIFRIIGIEFAKDHKGARGLTLCNLSVFLGSLLASFLLGVAFANIFRGIPIDADGVFHGSLFTFLNPYGLAGGLFFLLLFLQHGALWLIAKSEGELHERAVRTAKTLWLVLAVCAVLFLVLTAFFTKLYANYLSRPLLLAIPLICVCALFAVRWFMARSMWWKAWTASSVTIFAATLFGVIGLYPNLLPSTLNDAYSLTISTSASTPLTLKIMLAVALVFVPVVITYQALVYRLFRNKVKDGDEEPY